MNWTQMKYQGFKLIAELAQDDALSGTEKLDRLKAEVRPILETGMDGIIETLPAGIEEAVRVVYDHGGKDFALMFLVPLLAEELYQVWKALHTTAPVDDTTPAPKPAPLPPKPQAVAAPAAKPAAAPAAKTAAPPVKK